MDKVFLSEQSQRLRSVLEDADLKFALFSEDEWKSKSSDEKWSKKEIIGHLTDSAANNHIRFVRAQLAEGDFVTHKYEQNFFVSSQRYQDRKATDVTLLWKMYNLHLADVIANINPEKLRIICRIGDYEPQTLAFVVKDYIDHIEHHLKQVYEN